MRHLRQCVCVVACLLAGAAHALADESSAQQGWSTSGKGTTGGAGGAAYPVSNAEQFQRAIEAESPKIIRIMAQIKLKKPARITSDTTLMGAAADAKITGGGLHLRRVHNVIVRNLAVSEASDAIGIDESHHIWVDHCDLSNCTDGLIDIKRGSDFITVSWNHFHDHHKSCLLGHSDKDDAREIDRGHLRVTYHHNFFDGTKTRHPRVRFAEGVHVFNNYFRDNEYGVASVMDAGVIVEANVFEDVEHPTLTAYGDSPDPGRLAARDNLSIRSGKIETRGVVEKTALKYKYTVDPVDSIQKLITAQAGIRHDDEASDILSSRHFPMQVGLTWIYEFGDKEVVFEVLGSEMTKHGQMYVVRRTIDDTFVDFKLSVADHGVFIHQEGQKRFSPPLRQFAFFARTSDIWKWQGTVDQETSSEEFTNLGIQQITVPAGTYSTIAVRQTNPNDSDHATFWLVDGIGVVKLSGKTEAKPDGKGSNIHFEWQLKSIQKPKG